MTASSFSVVAPHPPYHRLVQERKKTHSSKLGEQEEQQTRGRWLLFTLTAQSQRQCRPCSLPPHYHLLTGHPQTLTSLTDASGESFFSFSRPATRKDFFFLGPKLLDRCREVQRRARKLLRRDKLTNIGVLGLFLTTGLRGFPLCAVKGGARGERQPFVSLDVTKLLFFIRFFFSEAIN